MELSLEVPYDYLEVVGTEVSMVRPGSLDLAPAILLLLPFCLLGILHSILVYGVH